MHCCVGGRVGGGGGGAESRLREEWRLVTCSWAGLRCICRSRVEDVRGLADATVTPTVPARAEVSVQGGKHLEEKEL